MANSAFHHSLAPRSVTLLLMLALPLVSACSDDSSAPAPTPTAGLATATSTAAAVPSATSTEAATPAPTASRTNTPLPSPTPSFTSTPSATASPPPSSTPTPTASLSSTPTPSRTPSLTATATPDGMQARGSVEQVYVINAPPQSDLELRDSSGQMVMTGVSDAQGSLILRNVAPGEGYQVYADGSSELSLPFEVVDRNDHPDASFYASQPIGPGYGYLRTRDGTLLAINVLMPGTPELGPYPTVIEYSGYDPANPGAPQPSMLIASTLGYAAVGVNMRGTGCSGGAFDFFETLQSTDGYDVIETIAAQPWVKGSKVGMVGVSYPGISQLFVAATQPPHLAAVAPLSVIADIGQGILYPGGILNDGFAISWAAERQEQARPGGQPWSQLRMNEGDRVCIDNQRLRDQTPDILAKAEENDFYVAEVAEPVSPATFVDRIQVPVFLAGAWQDEQTGGYFPTMIGNFTGTDKAHFTITNGGHIDSLDPAIFSRWLEFISLYVAEEIPRRPFTVQAILQVMAQAFFDVRRVVLAPERYNGITSYQEALALFESDPKVRVLFESGGRASEPGGPNPTFEGHFDQWPPATVQASTWYLREDDMLSPEPPSSDGADSYRYDPSRSQQTTLGGTDDLPWKALPPWNWRQPRGGRALSYATEPLSETLVMSGSGSVDLWLQSTAEDVDVQVTLSEIRPDGQEVYVQNGWLRASHRKLNSETALPLRPQHTHLREDAEPLPAGEYAEMRIEIYPFAHVFRAGSRIRLIVDTPGASRPRWKFRVVEPEGEVINTIAHSPDLPSKIVLPILPGIEPPAEYPACPGLRGQPCRAYQELE